MEEKIPINVEFRTGEVSLEELVKAIPKIQKLAALPFPPDVSFRYISVFTDCNGRVYSFQVEEYFGITLRQIKTYSPQEVENS